MESKVLEQLLLEVRPIPSHVFAAFFALFLGAWQLLRPKGGVFIDSWDGFGLVLWPMWPGRPFGSAKFKCGGGLVPFLPFKSLDPWLSCLRGDHGKARQPAGAPANDAVPVLSCAGRDRAFHLSAREGDAYHFAGKLANAYRLCNEPLEARVRDFSQALKVLRAHEVPEELPWLPGDVGAQIPGVGARVEGALRDALNLIVPKRLRRGSRLNSTQTFAAQMADAAANPVDRALSPRAW